MTKDEYRKYLKSDHWNEVREKRIKIDKHRCYLCGSAKYLNVHHLRYNNLGNEDVQTDLVTLCHTCHKMLHRIKDESQKEYRRYVAESRYGKGKESRAFHNLENRVKEKIIEELWLRDSNFEGDLPIFSDKMKTANKLIRIVKIIYPDIRELDISRDIQREIKRITF